MTSPLWSVELKESGRSGYLLYREAGRELRVYWEGSGAPQFDILLAPLTLSRWTFPANAPLIPLDDQLAILRNIRGWLAEQGIRSDLTRPPQTGAATTEACHWRQCTNEALQGSAYCPEHYDQSLLVP